MLKVKDQKDAKRLINLALMDSDKRDKGTHAKSYTVNISAVPSAGNCGVTFPTLVWQYSELMMTLQP